MATTRKIVRIDPEKCNGCGLCVPSCAEGAIKIIDAADNLCDGLGNCLGKCPQDAITIEEREADEFDARAVTAQHKAQLRRELGMGAPAQGHEGGCPGARARMLNHAQPAAATATTAEDCPSRLGHWPVQLALVPTSGPMWQGADVLIAADCVPFAMADFHEKLLAGPYGRGPRGQGTALAIACPKLDDVGPYVAKLATIFAGNDIKSITVAHMEVPCCGGIVRVVREALQRSGREDIPVTEITVGIDGHLQ